MKLAWLCFSDQFERVDALLSLLGELQGQISCLWQAEKTLKALSSLFTLVFACNPKMTFGAQKGVDLYGIISNVLSGPCDPLHNWA